MQDFEFHNPTRIVFGRGRIAELSRLVPAGATVLLTYGGGSIKRNGVYDQVMAALGYRRVVEFGGIEPNPTVETLQGAIELGRAEAADFVLAVGGGAVIDGSKLVAMAVHYEGDPWDIVEAHMIGGNPGADPALLARAPTTALPLGTVLTLPGTGSEANHAAVISSTVRREKCDFEHPAVFPRFSILDPTVTFSLPPRQVANGIADAFTHVLEQYLTYPAGAPLQDRLAESILQTLIEQAPRALREPDDYESRANVMWCATMALNTLLACGVPQDWSSHAIGHELTALHGIDHARTLAIVVPRVLHVQREGKHEKLLQYGQRVWGIDESVGDEPARVDAAIEATERFYQSLDIATRLSAYVDGEGTAATTPAEVARRLEDRGVVALGERGDLGPDKVQRVLEMSL